MCKIPRKLGRGFAYSYWRDGSSPTEGLRLETSRTLGFNISYAAFDTTSPFDSGWLTINDPNYLWNCLSEPTKFYKSTLID
jgi:hypothetical protein